MVQSTLASIVGRSMGKASAHSALIVARSASSEIWYREVSTVERWDAHLGLPPSLSLDRYVSIVLLVVTVPLNRVSATASVALLPVPQKAGNHPEISMAPTRWFDTSLQITDLLDEPHVIGYKDVTLFGGGVSLRRKVILLERLGRTLAR